MPTLIPYLRKSSKEDPALSRERQARAVSSWAALNEITLAPEVWEAGVSGSRSWKDRGLGQALAACVAGEADGIIVEDQSRLSRENGLATAEMWEAFQASGIRLVCVADGLDTATGDHELSFSVRAALARDQWKQYKRRSDDAKRSAIARGIHIGPSPYGYTRPHKGAKLEIDPAQVSAVRHAFERRAAGAMIAQIMAELNELAPGGPSGSGRWTVQAIRHLLGNRTYLGEARYGDLVNSESAHEAIISVELFNTVQALASQSEPRNHSCEVKSLLPGLVRCAHCGYVMTRTPTGRGYLMYRCTGQGGARRCPARPTIMLPGVDALVEDLFLERVRREIDQDLEPIASSDLAELNARIVDVDARRAPFLDPEYVQLIGGLEAARPALKALNAERAELQRQLVALVPSKRESSLDRQSILDGWQGFSLEARRELLASGIEAVIISRPERHGAAAASRVAVLFTGDTSLTWRTGYGSEIDAGMLAA